ncbi:PKD domain-containing protein [Puteibacter caeruleilacunae]|nr:PKD domain-containing protein [Puteibacter caeruleilacunae]
MDNFKILIVALIALLTSCSNDDELELIVTAGFEVDVVVEENKAIVSLINSSQNATSYEWSFPNAVDEDSTEENPTVTYTENGTYTITLVASDGVSTDTKSIEITIDSLFEYIPYRYLENEGVFMYYETDNAEVYQSLIPDVFDMPDRMLVFAFINDFYKLDYGVTPYKENGLFILVEYQGKEYWHCVYMPVTDEHSMWAGIIGLGLPKTMGEINFTDDNPLYYGDGTNPLGGKMNLSVNTENYTIDDEVKQEMVDLSLLSNLQIRNGDIIVMGRTGENKSSIIETAKRFPNLVTLKFGEASVSTNTDDILVDHPLDLTPSKMIGGYYMKNTIPFGLTGSPF